MITKYNPVPNVTGNPAFFRGSSLSHCCTLYCLVLLLLAVYPSLLRAQKKTMKDHVRILVCGDGEHVCVGVAFKQRLSAVSPWLAYLGRAK